MTIGFATLFVILNNYSLEPEMSDNILELRSHMQYKLKKGNKVVTYTQEGPLTSVLYRKLVINDRTRG